MIFGSKGQIGFYITLIAVVFVAIMVLALISPVTSSMFVTAASGLTGFEAFVIKHFNIVILGFLTLILFIGAAGLIGGER